MCPTEESGLLMTSLSIEINALYVVSGCGGDGNEWGAGAVGFEQGT